MKKSTIYKYQIKSSKGVVVASFKSLKQARESFKSWASAHPFQHPYTVGF